MATSVTQSLFGITPESIMQERSAAANRQAMDFARLDPFEAARYGLFRGASQLGDVAASAMGYEDPEIARAQARQGMLSGVDMSDPAALRQAASNTSDPQARVFLSDRAVELERKIADTARLKAIANRPGGGSGGGTGPERMATFVANVQARIAAGESVSEEERFRAQGFADVLSKNQFFQQEDGSIVSVPKNDYSRVRQLLGDGAVEIPSPLGDQPQTVPVQGTPVPATQGQQPAPQGQRPTPQQTPPRPAAPPAKANVISTPDSAAAAEKKSAAAQQNAALFENDILQIDKALDIVEKSGSSAAGWGSLLSWMPESKALDLNATLDSINAQKLINQIQALKETSATGSTGFGSLTEREGQLLIDRLGAIRQGQKPEVLKEALVDIRRLMGKLAGRDPKDRPGQFSEAQEQIISKTMAANKGKTREQVINGLKKKGYLK
jgi:hypothetical protein